MTIVVVFLVILVVVGVAAVFAGMPAGLIVSILMGGLAGGLVFGLAGLFEDSQAQAVVPRDVIRADGRFGLVFVLAFVLAFALLGGFVGGVLFSRGGGFAAGLVVGLVLGLPAGLANGMAYFGGSWTRYHIAVVMAAARRHGPLRFGRFLYWAHSAGLLRVSGVSYQFRHRELQDRLAERR